MGSVEGRSSYVVAAEGRIRDITRTPPHQSATLAPTCHERSFIAPPHLAIASVTGLCASEFVPPLRAPEPREYVSHNIRARLLYELTGEVVFWGDTRFITLSAMYGAQRALSRLRVIDPQ